MAEDIRSIKEIFEELLEALENYSKVRHTKDSVNLLWRSYGYSLREIRGAALYFSKTFLDGVRLSEASDDQVRVGVQKIGYAVNSCHNRCIRLVQELNKAFETRKIAQITDIERFLDLMTFEYYFAGCCDGNHQPEQRIFVDQKNLKYFSREARKLLKNNKVLSAIDIYRILRFQIRMDEIEKKAVNI
ncbi:hypothetical protein IKF92_02550 [Candidatus Saccharibacteria bacterium]|nr:hypothetical protein [Candidatus Saccharibacteria bacterium]